MTVEVIFNAGEWPKQCELWARDAEVAILSELGVNTELEVVCLLTDDEKIRELNAQFRGKDSATNVLSWPSVEYERNASGQPTAVDIVEDSLGDLAFGYQTCLSEAKVDGLENHFKHLTIHGILHLLGYDHIEEEHAETMEALEIAALSRLGIKNPYEDKGQ